MCLNKNYRAFVAAALLMLANLVVAGQVSPESVAGATTVSSQEAHRLFTEGVLFVDVRRTSEWEGGRIPGALHLDLKRDFNEAALQSEAEKNEPVVIYCNGVKCGRSSKACGKAAGWGYSKVYYYREGYPGWVAQGYPTE